MSSRTWQYQVKCTFSRTTWQYRSDIHVFKNNVTISGRSTCLREQCDNIRMKYMSSRTMWQYQDKVHVVKNNVTVSELSASLRELRDYIRVKYMSSRTGGGDSSVVRAPDSWLKGRGFESLLERRENFLLQGRLSVLTLISVSVPPPCYHSST